MGTAILWLLTLFRGSSGLGTFHYCKTCKSSSEVNATQAYCASALTLAK